MKEKYYFILTLLLILSLNLVSCTHNKSAKSGDDSSDEISLSDDFDSDDDDLDDLDDSKDSSMSKSDENNELDDDEFDNDFDEKQDDGRQISSSNPYVYTGKNGNYKVQDNETLMIIAFKVYGDYTKWRELKRMNSGSIGPNNSVKKGTILKYKQHKNKFVYSPKGNPYLIKNGDTLGIISNNVYNTPRKWKKIWNNNRKLIKNPNLIFAGFTIYYIPENESFAYKN